MILLCHEILSKLLTFAKRLQKALKPTKQNNCLIPFRYINSRSIVYISVYGRQEDLRAICTRDEWENTRNHGSLIERASYRKILLRIDFVGRIQNRPKEIWPAEIPIAVLQQLIQLGNDPAVHSVAFHFEGRTFQSATRFLLPRNVK